MFTTQSFSANQLLKLQSIVQQLSVKSFRLEQNWATLETFFHLIFLNNFFLLFHSKQIPITAYCYKIQSKNIIFTGKPTPHSTPTPHPWTNNKPFFLYKTSIKVPKTQHQLHSKQIGQTIYKSKANKTQEFLQNLIFIITQT